MLAVLAVLGGDLATTRRGLRLRVGAWERGGVGAWDLRLRGVARKRGQLQNDLRRDREAGMRGDDSARTRQRPAPCHLLATSAGMTRITLFLKYNLKVRLT